LLLHGVARPAERPSFPTRRSSDLSLMFGENEARRSTAPISSATPVSREIRTWRAAGSTRHLLPLRRSIRRAPRPCSRARRERSRSEEHTSELQSPYDLVCRLLLEK